MSPRYTHYHVTAHDGRVYRIPCRDEAEYRRLWGRLAASDRRLCHDSTCLGARLLRSKPRAASDCHAEWRKATNVSPAPQAGASEE